MIGRLNKDGRYSLDGLIKDPNRVKIWGIVAQRDGRKRYCVEADWQGCTHPKSYNGNVTYIHPDIKNDSRSSLQGGYWVTGDIFDFIYDGQSLNNKQASTLLSQEY